MKIDIRNLVKISSFKPEDKKKILENMQTLTPEALLDLWDLCLENLAWKVDIELSKRFHEGVFQGVINKEDHNDYTQLEKRILLDLFAQAELETRDEEISAVQNLIKTYKENNLPKTPPAQIPAR